MPDGGVVRVEASNMLLAAGEVAARILDSDRGARIIVASGYSNDPVMAQYRRYGFVDLLIKPFRVEDVSATLKRAIALEGNL